MDTPSRPSPAPASGAGSAAADAAAGVTALYQAHAVGLIRLAVVMLGDRAAAEDVVQDAFLGLYRHWARLAAPGNALPYVRSAVLNRCRNARRQRGRSVSRGAGHREAAAEAAVLIGEEHRHVHAAILALPGRQREALVLRFYLDMSEEEAAKAMGISRGTVKSDVPRGCRARPDTEGGLVSSTEDRARAAMRAIAATVGEAPPPLRLAHAEKLDAADTVTPADTVASPGTGPRRRGARGWYRPRWPVLAPVSAAVTVVAVAAALVVTRDVPNGGVAARSNLATSAVPTKDPGVSTADVPEYYVAWMQADAPYLIVGNTFTGKVIAVIGEPAGVSLTAVYGTAADDRTFVVTGSRLPGHGTGTAWYLLRLDPGGAVHARLVPLPVPVRQNPAGVALSPDGTEVAVALPGTPAALRIYSVATGALLRAWVTGASGELTAEKVPAGAWQFTASVLRWSPDGRQLAFAWNASAIRIIDAGASDGDLLAKSRQLTWIGTGNALESTFTCQPAQGWQPITITKGDAAGQGTACAGSEQYGNPQRNRLGFVLSYGNSHEAFEGLSAESVCSATPEPVNAAYLGWANSDGSEVIGSQVCGGHARFGLFHGAAFTPLPALPTSVPTGSGVMIGTDAW